MSNIIIKFIINMEVGDKITFSINGKKKKGKIIRHPKYKNLTIGSDIGIIGLTHIDKDSLKLRQ